jgi:hypothetical protein
MCRRSHACVTADVRWAVVRAGTRARGDFALLCAELACRRAHVGRNVVVRRRTVGDIGRVVGHAEIQSASYQAC